MFVALVLAIGAFVALRPDDEGGGDTTDRTTQPAETTTGAAPEQTTTEQTTPEARPREPEVQTIRVSGGRPVGGVQAIEVKQGETARFRVRTETPQDVHVHGYDLTESSSANEPADFRFPADETGIFEVEIHGTHTQIAELKVEP